MTPGVLVKIRKLLNIATEVKNDTWCQTLCYHVTTDNTRTCGLFFHYRQNISPDNRQILHPM